MTDRGQEEVDVWHASRAYLIGEIDADECEKHQKSSSERLKRAILALSRRIFPLFAKKPKNSP